MTANGYTLQEKFYITNIIIGIDNIYLRNFNRPLV